MSELIYFKENFESSTKNNPNLRFTSKKKKVFPLEGEDDVTRFVCCLQRLLDTLGT